MRFTYKPVQGSTCWDLGGVTGLDGGTLAEMSVSLSTGTALGAEGQETNPFTEMFGSQVLEGQMYLKSQSSCNGRTVIGHRNWKSGRAADLGGCPLTELYRTQRGRPQV